MTQEKLNAAEAAIISHQEYLNDTDWQVIAKYERGREMPSEVAEKRAQAVDEINRLRIEAEQLKVQLEVEQTNIEKNYGTIQEV